MAALLKRLCLALFAVHLSATAEAEDFVSFHTSNLQWLHGKGYQPGSERKHIATFEYLQGNRLGDLFFFIDGSKTEGKSSTYYAELSPRLSLSALSDRALATGPVTDVLLALNIEKPENRQARRLIGLGLDFAIPGFKAFKTHLYHRDDPAIRGHTWQFTLVWHTAFTWRGLPLVVEGFADLAGAENASQSNHQLIVPRLLVDIGALAGVARNRVYAGVEYSYWHNKFGINGLTESLPQLQLKWVFL